MRVNKVSVGKRPAVRMRVSRLCASPDRVPVTVAVVELWSFAAVSGEITAMVGAISRVARVRSTPGPATELMMTVACENSAAKVRVRQYELVKVSAGRNESEALKRCGPGRAVMSEPIAATRFCCHQ